MSTKRKQVIFDIDTKIAKMIFGEQKFRQPYADIRTFFKKNDFSHIEGSAYMSNNAISNLALSDLIDRLLEEYPYLTKCIKRIHQADISNIHSLESHCQYDGTPGKFSQEEASHENSTMKHTSLSERIAHKQKLIKQREKQRKPLNRKKTNERDL